MTAPTIWIKELVRTPNSGPQDLLTFTPGVNVIVGEPNTGKTKWLSMLDYLLGDPSQPAEAFGETLAEKYDTIQATLIVNGREIVLARRWKEKGAKGKVFVDDQSLPAENLSAFLLTQLNIPILHFPSGNPFAERRWPELSWRCMFRHIYRQQRFWGDLIPKQPDSEQHAVLMLFLGIAEHLFSETYGRLVELRKDIYRKQGAKDQFTRVLNEIAKEMLDQEQIKAGITEDTIDFAIARLQVAIDTIHEKREAVLATLADVRIIDNAVSLANVGQIELNAMQDAWANLQSERKELDTHLAALGNRLNQIFVYKDSLTAELSRLQRARNASQALSGLKVSNCPVCDQPLKSVESEPGHCFLCRQEWAHPEHGEATSDQRIEFETQQLKAELNEAKQLIESLLSEKEKRSDRSRDVDELLNRTERQLAPVRQASASILPPDISIFDMDLGRLGERQRQLERLKAVLDLRDQISREIDDLQHSATLLETDVRSEEQKVNWEQSGDLLAGGMNTYLNRLEVPGKETWSQGAVGVRLKERNFTFTVGTGTWTSKLGGTLSTYFLLAYQFGLLNLTPKPDVHYPGLTILDLPASLELDDGTSLADNENYILRPFIELLQKPGMETTQLIATGKAFAGLQGAHRIELTTVWE
jgi:hypothetical protein